MSELPSWTANLTPVDMAGAATLLGVSRRYLVDAIKKHGHYERRGAKKVFYPEHIALLRDALTCQDSNSNTKTEFGTLPAPSQDSAFEKALALATKQPQKNSKPNMKRSSGNATPMAKKQ